MAQNPLIKRYLDAGMAFTQMTQARAEAIVKDLVKTGEVQTQRAEALVNSLVERSRQNTDRLLDVVRKEVRSQIAGLGLATKDDVARLERKIAKVSSTTASKAPAKKRTSKKAATKRAKAASKKRSAKKAAPRSAAAKKSSS